MHTCTLYCGVRWQPVLAATASRCPSTGPLSTSTALHTAHCTLHIAHCTLHTAHCTTQYSAWQRTSHAPHSARTTEREAAHSTAGKSHLQGMQSTD
eukprot:792492-Rhodomonas_salina.1